MAYKTPVREYTRVNPKTGKPEVVTSHEREIDTSGIRVPEAIAQTLDKVGKDGKALGQAIEAREPIPLEAALERRCEQDLDTLQWGRSESREEYAARVAATVKTFPPERVDRILRACVARGDEDLAAAVINSKVEFSPEVSEECVEIAPHALLTHPHASAKALEQLVDNGYGSCPYCGTKPGPNHKSYRGCPQRSAIESEEDVSQGETAEEPPTPHPAATDSTEHAEIGGVETLDETNASGSRIGAEAPTPPREDTKTTELTKTEVDEARKFPHIVAQSSKNPAQLAYILELALKSEVHPITLLPLLENKHLPESAIDMLYEALPRQTLPYYVGPIATTIDEGYQDANKLRLIASHPNTSLATLERLYEETQTMTGPNKGSQVCTDITRLVLRHPKVGGVDAATARTPWLAVKNPHTTGATLDEIYQAGAAPASLILEHENTSTATISRIYHSQEAKEKVGLAVKALRHQNADSALLVDAIREKMFADGSHVSTAANLISWGELLSHPNLPPQTLELVEMSGGPIDIACPYCGTKPGPNHKSYRGCPQRDQVRSRRMKDPGVGRPSPASVSEKPATLVGFSQEDVLRDIAAKHASAFEQYIGASMFGSTVDKGLAARASVFAATPTGMAAIRGLREKQLSPEVEDALAVVETLASEEGKVEVGVQLEKARVEHSFAIVDQQSEQTLEAVKEAVRTGLTGTSLIAPNAQVEDGVVAEESFLAEKVSLSGKTVVQDCFISASSRVSDSRISHGEVGESATISGSKIGDSSVGLEATLESVEANGVTFGDRTIVRHSVLGTGALVKEGAQVRHSTVGEGAVIGKGANVVNMIIPDRVMVPPGAEVLEQEDMVIVSKSGRMWARFTLSGHSFWKKRYIYSVASFDATTGSVSHECDESWKTLSAGSGLSDDIFKE